MLTARKTIARGVDLVQVHTYFLIGQNIVEHKQARERAAYGREVLRSLAERLTAEFGRGFSKANIEYMRRFFLLYQDRAPIAQTGSGQSHSLPAKAKKRTKVSEIAQPLTGQSW